MFKFTDIRVCYQMIDRREDTNWCKTQKMGSPFSPARRASPRWSWCSPRPHQSCWSRQTSRWQNHKRHLLNPQHTQGIATDRKTLSVNCCCCWNYSRPRPNPPADDWHGQRHASLLLQTLVRYDVMCCVYTHSLHLFMIPELFLALSVLDADSDSGSISHDWL